MEVEHGTSCSAEVPSTVYNLSQFRSPAQSHTSQSWRSPSLFEGDHGWPSPPAQISTAVIKKNSVLGEKKYPQVSIADVPDYERQGHARNTSFASIQSDFSQSEDIFLGDLHSSGRGHLLPNQFEPRPHRRRLSMLPPSQWRWLSGSWTMYCFLLLGIVGAISHHIYYAHLNGKPARNQNTMLRYGTALAYVTKASLVAAIIFGLKQQIWATFMRKKIQVSTIDSLFASVDDPHALLNFEMATKAKTAFALAILIWIFPLLVILTPATLTVAPQTESLETTCQSVRTLNFDLERTRNWRDGHKINGLYELSPSLWNCTLPMSGGVFDPYNATFFDYYTAPAPGMQRLVTLSVLQKRVIEMENTNALVCGNGWNCTYSITFEGPGYKCDEVAQGIGDNLDGLGKMNAPFTTDVLIPKGNFSYIAHTSLGEYATIQMNVEPGGVPKEPAPYPPHLGALRTEPVVWIGFADINDRSVPLPLNRDNSSWSESFTPRIIKCEHYVTRYTLQFKQTLGSQQITLKNRTFIRRLIDTDFVPGVDAQDGTIDNVTATPESNYVLPLDVENYRFTAAYHAIGQLVRPYINGTITNYPTILPMQASDAVLTGLIDPRNFFVVNNFMQQFQSFYEDVIWSIFSNPSFYPVSWARAPDQPSGTLNATSDNLLWPCTKTRVINKFVYRKRDLWIAYTFAIVLAIVGVSLGAAAIAQNNHHPRDTRFSSIVAATRGAVLDEMPWKKSRWGEVPREVFKQRLEYGVISEGANEDQSQSLQNENSTKYFGFAPEGKVSAVLGQESRGRQSALSFRSLEQQ